MDKIQYYYRLNGLGIDNWNQKDVKKLNQELNSFDDLAMQFELLGNSYANSINERADIDVCVLPNDATNISGVIEISACHKFKKKMFKKEITESTLSLCLTMGVDEGIDLYFYETSDLDEVKQVFYDYIEKQQIPDLSNWELNQIRSRY